MRKEEEARGPRFGTISSASRQRKRSGKEEGRAWSESRTGASWLERGLVARGGELKLDSCTTTSHDR